jgi:two-component system, NarL family, sensor kinase
VAGAVAKFMLAGLAAATVFAVGSLLVLRELGRREAIRDAREFAVLAGQGIVEPALRDSVVVGDPEALASLDRLVQERVLDDRVARVKLWTRDGRIVYSDEPRLIGSVYRLDEDELDALRTGEAQAERAGLDNPENRFEREEGTLYEVYTRVRTPDGTPLLFETYQRAGALVSTGREIWLPFAAVLLTSLVLLWLVQVPLAWRLARRLDRSQREREDLLVKALEASEQERRRIAADLHDGVVQDLAGVSYSLSAAADRAGERTPAELGATLRRGASQTRGAIRQLRTLLVEIHPPNLRTAGLGAALVDLLAPLAARGIETELDVPDGLHLDADAELVLFRAAGEAIRNVQRHADASRVSLRVSRSDGRARLVVRDDGVGFTPEQRERSLADGHVGLTLLEELAGRFGGSLEVTSQPAQGAAFVLEVPAG